MRFQKQLIRHNPSEGAFGDCHRAVFASLMGIDIQNVPHFGELYGSDPYRYLDAIDKWLGNFKLRYLECQAEALFDWFGVRGIEVYHEIAGPSPRFSNTLHSVVGRNGEIIFDPHPDNDDLSKALLGDRSQWTYGLLVAAQL